MGKLRWLAVALVTACSDGTSDIQSSVGQCDLAPSAEVCSAAPADATTAAATEAAATPITAGVTWSIDRAGPGLGGYVVFTPTVSGTHTLYFGPHKPKRVCDETALCSSEIADCGGVLRAEQYAFAEGVPYVIELRPSNDPFMIRIEAPDDEPPPTGGLKLGPKAYYSSTGTSPRELSVGDVDGDGAIDAVVSNPDDAGGQLYVDVLANNGSGAFAHVARVNTSAPRETVVADFDGDGDNDIAGVAADGQGPLPNFVLHNDGGFAFTKTTWTPSLQYTGAASAGDFDEDGIPDLVTPFVPEAELRSGFVIQKMPAGTVLQDQDEFSITTSTAIAGDFNGDGHQDVLVGSAAAPFVRLWVGDGSGTVTFDREIAVPVNGHISRLVALDLDGDNATDFAAFGVGPEGFGAEGASITHGGSFDAQFLSSAAEGIAAGDFDHDGVIDLITGVPDAAADPELTWYRGTAGGYEFAGVVPGGRSTTYLYAVDVNNDGLIDLVTRGSDGVTGGIDVFLGIP